MNDFELALIAALQDDAQEISMTTDMQQGSETLSDSLDRVDRTRRIWVVVGCAVAATALLGVGFVLGGRPAPSSPDVISVPVASSSSPPTTEAALFVGEWQTSFTKAQAKDVLEAAGLGTTYDRVMSEFPHTSDRLTWRLTVDPSEYRLLLVRGDGSTESFDLQRYSLSGRTLTADPANASRKRVIFDLGFGTDSTLTMRLLGDDSAPLAAGVPDESMQRVLYTTAAWTRVP